MHSQIHKRTNTKEENHMDAEKKAFDPLGGDKWFPLETNFEDELGKYWGDCGCSSEVDELKSVVMHRPGKELDDFDYREVRFRAEINPELFRQQHDSLADFYRSHGICVHYIEGQREDKPNAVFARDLILMTPEGAIICRPAMSARRGEEVAAARTLAKLNIPIIRTICGDGYFEGANVMWVNRKTAILATGARANKSGIEQVAYEFKRIGVDNIIYMQTPCGQAHIDGVFNIASHDIAMMYPPQVPYDVVDSMKKLGYKVLECPDTKECKEGFAVNFVALKPGEIVMPSGNFKTQELLENNGIKVHTLDYSEVVKGWGGMHCCTAFLKRIG